MSQIVREEMNVVNAQECLLPQLQPADLWQESGRWETYTQAEGIMFSLNDRRQTQLGLGPTHEEVITALAKDMIHSYRQLPVNLYQIQTKFRDEIRPRFGLMRGREFIMKDAYSFHTSPESLQETYEAMDQAYQNIISRCGLAFRAVQADSGAIGGSASQEFMILAEAGEDKIFYTEDGKYAANVEKAVSLPLDAEKSPFTKSEIRETPATDTIEKLCKFLKCSPTVIVKNVLYEVLYDNGKTVIVLIAIRGDHEINEVKLKNELAILAPQYEGSAVLDLGTSNKTSQQKWTTKPLPLGYIGPDLEDDYINNSKDYVPKFLRIVDKTIIYLENFITGANKNGYHQIGSNWDKDFKLPKLVMDVRTAMVGDRAVHDKKQTLKTARGIEIGHIFQLGTKYSRAMGATFTNEKGEEQPLVMGCYGVGVSRLAQAAVEQFYDRDGIVWPVAIAPYHVVVVIPNINDLKQIEVAEKLYNELNRAGVETLLDDRDERAGVKFKDAELIGIPYRVVTGRSLKSGKVEVVERARRNSREIAIEEVVVTLKQWVTEMGTQPQ